LGQFLLVKDSLLDYILGLPELPSVESSEKSSLRIARTKILAMEVLQSESVPSPRFEPISTEPTRRRKIHCKQELIVSSLQRFYAGRNDIDKIVEMLQGTSDISLRVIDWFVTNFARTHNTSYILHDQEFLVYRDYKSQLKAYSKKLFDPFCRRERIYFQVPNHSPFLTTVAKLNFFRWAIEKEILQYIHKNQEVIEKEMNQSMKELAKLRSSATPSTGSSTSTVTTTTTTASSKSSTRRRLVAKDSVSIKLMQKHSFDTEMKFD
jgi:hypothetical protein